MKKFSKVLSLVLVLAMMGSLVACGGNKATSTKDTTTEPVAESKGGETENTTKEKKEEPIELSIFARQITEVGVQTDAVAKEIEKRLGIKLNVYKNGDDANLEQTLSTMMASNDLADIQYLGTEKNVVAAIKSGMIIPLDDLLPTYAPDIMNNSDLKLRLDYNKERFAEINGGKNYVVSLWGGTGIDVTPMAGPYIRWDLYKQLGYPEVNNMDDFVNVLKQMQDLNPETADGQKVYGLSGWFGDSLDWGDWPVRQMFGWSRGRAVINYYTSVDISKNEIMPNTLKDTKSFIWDSIEMYYKAQQAGILDPDSPTQKNDKYMEKVKSGRVLTVPTGWDARVLKTDLDKVGIKDAAFIALPAGADDQGTVMGWSGYLPNAYFGISANCKHPEKALELINFISSPKGARLMHSGVEGSAWEMKDGKPAYTDAYLADLETLDKKSLGEKYAAGKYRFFSGYQLNVISPKDGEMFDLIQAPAYTAKTYNEAEKDAIAHYGVDSITDIYLKDKKPFVYITEYTNFPDMPSDLKTMEANLKNYIFNSVFKCIYAKDDNDFSKKKAELISGLEQYKIDDIYNWYVEQYNKNKSELSSQIEPLVNEFVTNTVGK